MPKFDGTGPRGMGPRTGRGMGPCGMGFFGGRCGGCHYPCCPYFNFPTEKDRKEYLRDYLKSLEEEIEDIKKELEDSEKTA